MKIGPYSLSTPLALAPMAGITDKPFRQICRSFGAQWVVGEMLSSDPSLRHTRKTQQRANHDNEDGIRVVQIAGSEPQQMADAAFYNVQHGAQVIDINMGCPAKKVCHVQAGSALLQNEALVDDILQAVVQAVDVPVTLKTRLGWDDEHRNINTIAKIAEAAGIAALAIHGRTRTQMYKGEASYDLIAQVKAEVSLPIWVNGDLSSPQRAMLAWQETAADGMMVGRAAQGNPWIFRDISYYYEHGRLPEQLSVDEHVAVVMSHIQEIHQFYGDSVGVRIARKHITWYLSCFEDSEVARKQINAVNEGTIQLRLLGNYLSQQAKFLAHWPCEYRY